MNQILIGDQLRYVNQLSKTVQQQAGNRTSTATNTNTCTVVTTHPLCIGGGPPIPGKLVCQIQKGCFSNMAELLSNNLEATNWTDDDQTTNTKHKQQDITEIMDWIQYFSTYIAVGSRAKPERVADLIAYLNLIINSQRRFQDFNWALYDHQFRQKLHQPLS